MKPLVLLAVLAALALSAAGCGDEGAVSAGPVATGTAGTPPADGSTVGGPSGGVTTTTVNYGGPPPVYEIWFTRGDALELTHQLGEPTPGVLAAALTRLLAGPGAVTGGTSSTAVPAGTRLLGVDIDKGVATVDLSSEFESGGGSRSMFMRLAQLVYTATQFDTVKSVRLHLDGEPVDVFSGEGIVLDKPLTRKDYEELLPPIVVETPVADDFASSPLIVSGSSNVFEANVTLILLDENGKELIRTFTTATCGTGCRGRFNKTLTYDVDKTQFGTLIVQDDDADGDGKPSYKVEIPLRLEPS
jgi:Sporulation and spore germination/Immunoglobulin-like domain of bacterial spore germination